MGKNQSNFKIYQKIKSEIYLIDKCVTVKKHFNFGFDRFAYTCTDVMHEFLDEVRLYGDITRDNPHFHKVITELQFNDRWSILDVLEICPSDDVNHKYRNFSNLN